MVGATNTKLDYSVLEKRDDGMCTLFKEIAEENRAEGIEKGSTRGIIETGLDFGLSENDILAKLQVKLEVSLKMAQEYFNRIKKIPHFKCVEH